MEGAEPPSYLAPEDHDNDGIPNSEDPEPFNDPQAEVKSAEFPYWSGTPGAGWTLDDQSDADVHDSGLATSQAADSDTRGTGTRSGYADLLKDQPGAPSPLDREGSFSQAPPVDLSNAPPSPPPPILDIPRGAGVKGSSSAGMPLTSGDLTRLGKQGKTDRKRGRGGKEQGRR